MNDTQTTRPLSTTERLEVLEIMRWADDGGPCVEEEDQQLERRTTTKPVPASDSRRHSRSRNSARHKSHTQALRRTFVEVILD